MRRYRNEGDCDPSLQAVVDRAVACALAKKGLAQGLPPSDLCADSMHGSNEPPPPSLLNQVAVTPSNGSPMGLLVQATISL